MDTRGLPRGIIAQDNVGVIERSLEEGNAVQIYSMCWADPADRRFAASLSDHGARLSTDIRRPNADRLSSAKTGRTLAV